MLIRIVLVLFICLVTAIPAFAEDNTGSTKPTNQPKLSLKQKLIKLVLLPISLPVDMWHDFEQAIYCKVRYGGE